MHLYISDYSKGKNKNKFGKINRFLLRITRDDQDNYRCHKTVFRDYTVSLPGDCHGIAVGNASQ